MTEQIAIHCLNAIICEEVCEECELYGHTGTDHCEADAVRIAIAALEKQAEYKSLEEQGLLLRLPCKIGSDVFFVPSKANFGLNILHHRQEFNRVYHQKVARINFTENGWYVEGNMYLEYGVTDRLFVDKLYKETWFTTKEEAEAALEKMKGGTE